MRSRILRIPQFWFSLIALSLIMAIVWLSIRNRHQLPELRQSIHEAATSLVSMAGPSGKFNYRIDPKHPEAHKDEYNIVRHAGAIFALSTYEGRYPNPEVRSAITRALDFMIRETIRPINDRKLPADLPPMSVVLNVPDSEHRVNSSVLGGTGLGLIGVMGANSVLPERNDLELARRLGRFILYMQKPDGSFYSSYDLALHERSDDWTSLYYPGEALLGLTLLYKKDRQDVWLDAIAKGLKYLVDSRKRIADIPPDNWVLLATNEFLQIEDLRVAALREDVIHHAIQIDLSEKSEQVVQPPESPIYGCYSSEGYTTPTATRTEGQLASLFFLPMSQTVVRNSVIESVQAAMGFLLRSQTRTGIYAGSIPRTISVPYLAEKDPHGDELRIDYTQHALSAMLQFEKLGLTPE